MTKIRSSENFNQFNIYENMAMIIKKGIMGATNILSFYSNAQWFDFDYYSTFEASTIFIIFKIFKFYKSDNIVKKHHYALCFLSCTIQIHMFLIPCQIFWWIASNTNDSLQELNWQGKKKENFDGPKL